MLEKKEFEIPSEKFKKGATVYTDSDTPVKLLSSIFTEEVFYMEEEKIFHALT